MIFPDKILIINIISKYHNIQKYPPQYFLNSKHYFAVF